MVSRWLLSSGTGWKTPIRLVLGLSFWVQGFRVFTSLAGNFFVKDELNSDPAILQLIWTFTLIPMIGKPLYGVISDAVYIRGQHRIPYIAIGVFLQAISFLAAATFSKSTVSIFSASLFCFFASLGASITEVANDALVTETANQFSFDNPQSSSSSSRELQSFVWIALSVGGFLGNLLGSIAIARYSPQIIFLTFGLILIIQLSITMVVRESSFNLPKSSPNSGTGIRKQISELSVALRKSEIACSITWLTMCCAISPALTASMFFYQTEYLKVDPSVLGVSKISGQAAMILLSAIYNHHLKSVPARKLIVAIQATMVIFIISDALFVKGIYRSMGLPDTMYVLVFSSISEALFLVKILPFRVLLSQFCPPGCEGSVFAFAGSTIGIAWIVSGYLGSALSSYFGIKANDFSWFPSSLLIQAGCTFLPILWSSYIPDERNSKTRESQYDV